MAQTTKEATNEEGDDQKKKRKEKIR